MNDRENLGYHFYRGEWHPIHIIKKDFFYTQAFIFCSKCKDAIRSVGGPRPNSLCMKCFKQKYPEKLL